ncbi:MAG: SPW repeat protein [Patescibacteria group bacterium]|nr:SPW repeat protein [Patescibacteria group bacterium]MDE2015292.1 SPW repeat protein [Patescibacteria group bacterium]MDE2227097.1 SPW repeat protein [Patescibacteria group bacterium]
MISNWARLAIGFWILISPWLLGFSSITIMKWSNLIAGLIIIILNVWQIFGEKRSSVADNNLKNIKP